MSFTLGLTGGVGCGKSTASQFLAEHGCMVIDCDKIVHQLFRQDLDTEKALCMRFGEAIMDINGGINRCILKNSVFDAGLPPEEIHKNIQFLEDTLHPKVHAFWRTMVEQKNMRYVVEIPLLFEKNFENLFDITVCVSASPEIQIQRLEQKGMSPLHIQTMLARQLPLSEKCARADVVLSNNGSLEFLKAQINHFTTHYFH